MRLSQLLHGVELLSPPKGDVEVAGVSYDTRTLRPGEVYVALRGYKTDGHLYLDEAVQKGAAAVVAEEGENALLVPDGRAALATISANWFGHPSDELVLIGVTGTNGKTTVTTLLWQMLREVFRVPVGLIGTNRVMVGQTEYPAQRTTPESYEVQSRLRQMADAGCKYAVMEVSSHALCLHRVDGLTFEVGAFTNLTQDHLDFHKTMENYRQAKGRLFVQSRTAVLNADDDAGRLYAKKAPCPVFTYAQHAPADLTACGVDLLPGRVAFTAQGWGREAPVTLHIPGAFSVYNALCALACGYALGIPLSAGAKAIERGEGVKGRMEVVSIPGPGTVVIDYAHTPDALENALTALRGSTKGRLICLFGCGGDRDRTKRPIMGAIAQRLADLCVVTSDNPRSEDPEAILLDILSGMERGPVVVEPDREKAIALALGMLREGDALLLAGKGHETYQEVNGVKRHMDERELVATYFLLKN